MEQTVYVDLLFLINLSMDFLCLFLVAKLLARPFSFFRGAVAAALGGVYSVVSLFALLPPKITLMADVGVCLLLCLVTYWRRGLRLTELFLVAATFFLASMLLGGIMTAIFMVIYVVRGRELFSWFDNSPSVLALSGTFISANGYAVYSYANAANNQEVIKNFITGGTFSSDVSEYVTEDFDVKAIDGGMFGIVAGLTGEGTEANPYLIYNISDLILFRDSVNAGKTKYNANGVYVKLAADIDMAGIDWSVNIGDDCNATFDGIFDGKNFTIKNLTSTETAQKADGYVCTGLFGAIGGNAVIKNLTIDNAEITAEFDGNNAGVLVGFVYGGNCTIENVTVKNATVNASGIYGTGAIVGYVYYSKSLTIKDCEVIDTTITAVSGAGAVVGHTTGNVSVENCSVSNVSIEAQAIVGGIAGVVTNGFTATGSTVKDVTLTVTKPNWVNSTGIVVGAMSANAITVSGTVYENVNETAIVGSGYAEHPDFVVPAVQANIGDVYYTTLEAAIAAAQAGDVIVLVADVEINAYIKITADKSLVLDLNGFAIDGVERTKIAIMSYGDLTVRDTSAAQTVSSSPA